MIAIIAPEPTDWLSPVFDFASRRETARVFAPWGMRPRRLIPLRGSLATFSARRRLSPLLASSTVSAPGWPLGEIAVRAWIGDRADRRLRARFAMRRATGNLAAQWLTRQRRLSMVIAPSLCAAAAFAAAEKLGAQCVLLEDLPDLRGLHADLDRAARAHPACAFLRRFRADHKTVARQEVERILANRILVRGSYARSQRIAAGTAPDAIDRLPIPTSAAAGPAAPATSPTILLAGLAAARHGSVEALAALEHLPDVTLLIRPGEGLEPPELRSHPRVRPATWQELERLDGVSAVIAPAWCESYPKELSIAAIRGVPIVATARAAGHVALSGPSTREVDPGDVPGLVAAVKEFAAARTNVSATPIRDVEITARHPRW